MKRFLRAVFAFILPAVLILSGCYDAPPENDETPYLSGQFLQPWTAEAWSDERWTDELNMMKELDGFLNGETARHFLQLVIAELPVPVALL